MGLWRFPLEPTSLWHKVIKSKYGIQQNACDVGSTLDMQGPGDSSLRYIIPLPLLLWMLVSVLGFAFVRITGLVTLPFLKNFHIFMVFPFCTMLLFLTSQ